MVPFLCAIAGSAVGCMVCTFGMWAFLSGQRSAIQVKWGGLPDSLSSKKEAGGSVGNNFSGSQDLTAQIQALFGGNDGE